jgi:hypothetical protein
MSADNGIYILKTKRQYRVIQAAAIENLYWSYATGYSENLVPTRLVEYFGSSPATYSKEIAYDIAFSMNKQFKTEYNVSLIETNLCWAEVVKYAQYLARYEIDAIKNKYPERKHALIQLEIMLLPF